MGSGGPSSRLHHDVNYFMQLDENGKMNVVIERMDEDVVKLRRDFVVQGEFERVHTHMHTHTHTQRERVQYQLLISRFCCCLFCSCLKKSSPI